MRFAVVYLLALLAACGSHKPDHLDGSIAADSPNAIGDAYPADGISSVDGAGFDAPMAIDAHVTVDAFPGVLDVRIDCHNTCVLTANPAMIAVSAGTAFEVNWINVGDTDCDVAKIDQFNQVPIIIGLQPGTSYHDPVHQWCGSLFTGTFDFRISICTLPSYIPVNCGA